MSASAKIVDGATPKCPVDGIFTPVQVQPGPTTSVMVDHRRYRSVPQPVPVMQTIPSIGTTPQPVFHYVDQSMRMIRPMNPSISNPRPFFTVVDHSFKNVRPDNRLRRFTDTVRSEHIPIPYVPSAEACFQKIPGPRPVDHISHSWSNSRPHFYTVSNVPPSATNTQYYSSVHPAAAAAILDQHNQPGKSQSAHTTPVKRAIPVSSSTPQFGEPVALPATNSDHRPELIGELSNAVQQTHLSQAANNQIQSSSQSIGGTNMEEPITAKRINQVSAEPWKDQVCMLFYRLINEVQRCIQPG